MTLTDKFAIVGSISSTLAFIAYLLVEYAKLATNVTSINKSVVTLTNKFPRITKSITLFAFFGSIGMATILGCLVFDPAMISGTTEKILLVLSVCEALFWLRRAANVI